MFPSFSKKKRFAAIECKHCGTRFEPVKPDHVICTRKCRRAWEQENKPDTRVLRNCAQCEEPFLSKNRQNKYCSKNCATIANKDQAMLRKSVCADMREYRQMKLNNKGFDLWFKENHARKE